MNRPVEDMQPLRIDMGDVIMSPFDLLSEHHRLFIPLVICVAFNLIMEISMCVDTLAMLTDLTSAFGSGSIVPEISSSTLFTYGIIISIVFIISL